jgi:hypothetical protein
MRNLIHILRFRFSDEDVEYLNLAKQKGIKPSDFVRVAIREKAERDLDISKECPF